MDAVAFKDILTTDNPLHFGGCRIDVRPDAAGRPCWFVVTAGDQWWSDKGNTTLPELLRQLVGAGVVA